MQRKKLLFALMLPLMLIGTACSTKPNSSESGSSDISSSELTTSEEILSSVLSTIVPSTDEVTTSNGVTTSEGATTSNGVTTSEGGTTSNGVTTSDKVTSSKDNDSKESSKPSSSSSLPSSFVSVETPKPKDGDIYISPNGSDSNDGSKERPFYSLAKAVSYVQPGTTIFCEEGTYKFSERINLTASGTEDKPITIQATDWKNVVFDFSDQPYGFNSSTYVGIYLKGNYWRLQGLEICHAGDNGIKVEGSYNYIGRCVLHHNGDSGIQLGFGHDFSASGLGSKNDGSFCAYNLIENCDSYLNYDFDNWGDADGFACKMHNGIGNVFKGCRAWSNVDDAWDLYETDFAVGLIDCWCWGSAKLNDFKNDPYFSDSAYLAKKGSIKAIKVSGVGNGNGMKFGGNGTGGSSKGTHYAINCVSFNNDKSSSNKGFDENSHGDGVILENCVGWDNGYNYMFENGGSKTSFTNCVSFYTETRGTSYNKANRLAGECGSGGTVTNCNFTLDGGDLAHNKPYITASDFVTLSENDAKAPRQNDGSLPNNGFAMIKESSSFYASKIGLKHD